MKARILVLLLLLPGCSTRETLLELPPLQNQVPEIETGFYLAYKVSGDGVDSAREVGALYLYNDEFLLDGVRFMGIRGSFYPGGLIWTQQKDGRPWIVGKPDPDGERWAEMNFERKGSGHWNLHFTRDDGTSDTLFLRYIGLRGKGKEPSEVLYVAHRGTAHQPPHYVGGLYPANTIPAFEAALRSGFDGFELDVRITRDLRWVVSHDEDLSVATLSSGLVREKILEEARRCTVVASTTIPEVKGSAVDAPLAALLPSLEEVLEGFLRDPRLRVMVIDVKPDEKERIRAAAMADFGRMGEADQRKITFLVRTEETAAVLRQIMPHSTIALEGSIGLEPVRDPGRFLPETAGRPRGAHNAVSFGAGWWLTRGASGEIRLGELDEFNGTCHRYGYKLICWTVSDKSRWHMILGKGFAPDIWITDAPTYLLGEEGLQIFESKRSYGRW